MTKKFDGKYRADTARAKWWNYANNDVYFVTICTENREHFFGEISDGKMVLNDVGKIVADEWKRTFNMRPDMNLWMDEFVVMPNHFHGIIGIGENKYNNVEVPDLVETQCPCAVETQCIASLQQQPKNKFGPQSKNLSSIIRGFKSAVTIRAKKINPQFAWQTRFHDHIIRTEKSLENIRNYVQQNPATWHRDRNNDLGLWMNVRVR